MNILNVLDAIGYNFNNLRFYGKIFILMNLIFFFIKLFLIMITEFSSSSFALGFFLSRMIKDFDLHDFVYNLYNSYLEDYVVSANTKSAQFTELITSKEFKENVRKRYDETINLILLNTNKLVKLQEVYNKKQDNSDQNNATEQVQTDDIQNIKKQEEQKQDTDNVESLQSIEEVEQKTVSEEDINQVVEKMVEQLDQTTNEDTHIDTHQTSDNNSGNTTVGEDKPQIESPNLSDENSVSAIVSVDKPLDSPPNDSFEFFEEKI